MLHLPRLLEAVGAAQWSPMSPAMNGDASNAGKAADRNSANGSRFTWIYILVFKGQPRDDQETRTTQLYIERDNDEGTSQTFHLRGVPGVFTIEALTNQGPVRGRPGYITSKFCAGRVPTSTDVDARLRDAILQTPTNGEWDHLNWLHDVLQSIRVAWPNDITNEEINRALDAAVIRIFQQDPS